MAFGDDSRARAVGHPRAQARGAAEVAPDILLVPLAAFDRAGNRIGYGAGYYDMTIVTPARQEDSDQTIGLCLRCPGNSVKFPVTPRDEAP